MTKPNLTQPDGSDHGDPFAPLEGDDVSILPVPGVMPAEFPVREPSTQE